MFYKLVLDTPILEMEDSSWVLTLPTIIGRNPEHGVFLDHHSISRTHCKLPVNAHESLLIKDLGSTNGIYFDDNRVEQHQLFPGEKFQIGALTFHIEYESNTDHGKPAYKPKSFELTETAPMATLKKSDLPEPTRMTMEKVPEKKWWEFWK